MKKLIITSIALVLACQCALAWGRLGHATVIAVAERHLTEKTKANIAKYFSYDLQEDAVWMDKHRHDKEIAYTSSWHVYNVGPDHCYDPNPRLYKGDVMTGIVTPDYNLRRYKELTDSAVVMNVRMLIHFVGDMHCPTHSYFPGPRCFWPCTLKGKKQRSFHSVYDKMPDLVYRKTPANEIAAKIDNCKKGEIKKIQAGTFYDWAKSCGDNNCVIYDWNPFNTEELNPNTVELSKDLIDVQMRNAGYRLARLLNEYFGK